MPMVDGKSYSYDKKGKKMAAFARLKMLKEKMKKRMKKSAMKGGK